MLKLENTDIDIIATNWDIDFRVCEIEWLLEDNIMSVGIDTFNLKGDNSMALSRYEQAKIMILGGVYDKETLTKQLTRYEQKGLITKAEYDELIALMEAKELVAGE